MNDLPFEVVERKGLGHPDTICDLLANRISLDLTNFYQKTCGEVLHYNIDKALLLAGSSNPNFMGGKILAPCKLYLGDCATTSFKGKILKIDELIENSIRSWLIENLRYLRLGENLELKNKIRQGALSLSSTEKRNVANDTSVGVGNWPLSFLEKLVLETESLLNSKNYKKTFPEIGEDIKVMAIRHLKMVEIILACAIIDRTISSSSDYFEKKQLILKQLKNDLLEKYAYQFDISISFNTLDVPSAGLNGLYLTVTGLSCESGDSGQVGRGNRISGLISFMRPQTMEAWAGKNFQTHVGRIYSYAAQDLAKVIIRDIEEVSEATLTLVGKIGMPVSKPLYTYCDFKMRSGNKTHIKEKVLDTLKKATSSGKFYSLQ